MEHTDCFDGEASESFLTLRGVKQDSVLTPTLIWILFLLPLSHVFMSVHNFNYQGFYSSDNLSFDAEVIARLDKAAAVISKLNREYWKRGI